MEKTPSLDTGKCMFCESSTKLSIACDECWRHIVEANVTNGIVFGCGQDVSYSEITELKKWSKLGND